MRRLAFLLGLLACSKGGRLVEALKPVRKHLEKGDTVAAARAYLEALYDRLTASAYVSEDVGWEDFGRAGRELVSALCEGAGARELPQAWVRLNLALRVLERLYDLRPQDASPLGERVEGAYRLLVRRSVAQAESLASLGDTSGALEVLAQAAEALSTPLPRFRDEFKTLGLERARLGASWGRLTPGMSVAQAESLLGKPLSVDTAFAALSGRLGVVYRWETLSAFVVDDTVEDVIRER